jgi:hypothetical protein
LLVSIEVPAEVEVLASLNSPLTKLGADTPEEVMIDPVMGENNKLLALVDPET